MSITIEPQLQHKLDQAAQRLGKPAEEIAAEAIRTRLEELDIQTLDEESAPINDFILSYASDIFSNMLPSIKGR